MIQLAWGLGEFIKVVGNKEKLVYYFGTEHENVQFKIPKRFFKYFRWDPICVLTSHFALKLDYFC